MKKLIALIALLPILFAGCGKEGPSEGQVEGDFLDNEWYRAVGKTPKNRTPTFKKAKGDTAIPDTFWRIIREDTVWYDMNIGTNDADFPVHIKWCDTLVVSYDIANPGDTVIYKPTPYYTGDFRFYYKIVGNKWQFYGLTPGKIESDSADPHVVIDSVQIKVNGSSLPTITSATQLILAEDYPYIFDTGDSVNITVYKKPGTINDTLAKLFLCVPVGDWISNQGAFHNIAPYVWTGTWVPQNKQAHWAWIYELDLGVFFHKNQMASRDVLWGIPYKVE